MPTVTLSESCDRKLKALVTDPFEQTRETLIEALIDEEVHRRGMASNGNGQMPVKDNVLRQDPASHDNLDHTRVISATVDGRDMYRPKWNTLMNDLHVLGRKRLGSFEALQKASSANLRQRKHEKDGYKYLPDADLSIQGVSANLAWKHSLAVARALNVPITVKFEWRDKEGAAHPGETGVLEWKPAQ
jgi:hypothetical protein